MLATLVKRAGLALFAVGLSATAGLAQNFDGTGIVKFGVFGQGTWMDVGITQPFIGSASPSGFGGGVSAGYDLVSKGNWLLGAEIDGSFGDARGKAGGLTDFGFDYLMTLRGRVGFFPRHDWLIYGTAGVGFLGIEAQNPGIGQKAFETLPGFVGGIGTEIDWAHVILFGEYLYGDYGSRNFNIGGVRHDVDSVQTHLMRLGVKFKVGHDYEHDLDRGSRGYEPMK